jgi:hypothetical protein
MTAPLDDPARRRSFGRMRQHIIEMVGGRGTLRFLIQPGLAILLGVIHGIRDHRRDREPYLIGLVHATGHRAEYLRKALRQIPGAWARRSKRS